MRNLFVYTTLTAICLAAGGCAAIGWAVNAFAPPKKVKPVYEPPKTQTALVFVDDLCNPVSYEPVKAELAQQLTRQLRDHHIAAKVIPSEKVMDLAAGTPNFNALSIPDVGKKLGADWVLYVQIDRFSLRDSEESHLWHGVLQTTIKVVDVKTGPIWPKDRPAGMPVKPVIEPLAENSSPTYGLELSRRLAERTADRIAKLFYEHEVPTQELSMQESGEGEGFSD